MQGDGHHVMNADFSQQRGLAAPSSLHSSLGSPSLSLFKTTKGLQKYPTVGIINL
jgi:hypothetical protein